MPVVVQKYGGSSVADIDKLSRVADQVVQTKKAGHDVVVVVSAMGKTTDSLLSLAAQAARSAETISDAGAPKRELDMLVSTGERVSMSLLSIAIHARGFDAVSFTGSQSGIITNDRHFDARIIEVRPHRLEDELARGKIVIVAGYQGMSYKREITTLGRGGSDTTAVALAAALGAERCEIYSDVDGVYSADPRVVPDARHLPTLDYETMQEMAEAGAKVLNAQAVEWARRSRVTIAARRTGDALGGGGRETLVNDDNPQSALVLSVVVARPVVLIESEATEVPRLLSVAQDLQLPIGDSSILGKRAAVWCPLVGVPNAEAAVSSLAGAGFNAQGDRAVVSLVGVESGNDAARVARALAMAPEGSCTFTHPLRQSFVVPTSAADTLARQLHQQFVSTADAPGKGANLAGQLGACP
ncbi:MAG: aspartate kinase [Polyangiaceae bacterium]